MTVRWFRRRPGGHMRATILGIAAVAVLSLPLTARAAETRLLAGVGSLGRSYDDAFPTINLKGDATTTAETVDVHGPIARGVAWAGGRAVVGAGRLAVGGVRYAAGGPFYRPWG